MRSATVRARASAVVAKVTSRPVQPGSARPTVMAPGQPTRSAREKRAACRVTDPFQLPGGAKRLVFDSGELLTIHTGTRLVALRLVRVRGGDPARALATRHHRR